MPNTAKISWKKNCTYSGYACNFRQNFKLKINSHPFVLPSGAPGNARMQPREKYMSQDKSRFYMPICVLNSFEIVLRLIRQQKETVHFNQA